MKLKIVTVMVLAMGLSSAALAGTVNCSNADASLKYSYARPDSGIQPIGGGPEAVSSWTYQGKTYPGSKFEFDYSSDIQVLNESGPAESNRTYVTYALVNDGRVPMICHEHTLFLP